MKSRISGVDNLSKEFQLKGKTHFLVVHSREFDSSDDSDMCLYITIGTVGAVDKFSIDHNFMIGITVSDFRDEFNSSVVNTTESVLKEFVDTYMMF